MTLTLSPAKVGTWALHEVLTSAQANKIASELVKAVDGVGGGSYSLTVADLTFTGSKKAIFDLAMQLTAGKVFSIDGHIDLSSTGRIDLASGAGINVNAGSSINLASGGALSLASGAAIESVAGAQLAGELDVPSGSIIKFTRTQDLAIDTETFTRRSFMVPFSANPAHWLPAAGPGPTWVQHATAVSPLMIPLHGLLPGDVIIAVALQVQGAGSGGGAHGALPAVLPTIDLFSVSGAGFQTSLCATQDTGLTLPQYEAQHALVLNAGSLISGAMPTVGTDPIFLRISGESGANAVADAFEVLSFTVVGTRTKIANSHDFG